MLILYDRERERETIFLLAIRTYIHVSRLMSQLLLVVDIHIVVLRSPWILICTIYDYMYIFINTIAIVLPHVVKSIMKSTTKATFFLISRHSSSFSSRESWSVRTIPRKGASKSSSLTVKASIMYGVTYENTHVADR